MNFSKLRAVETEALSNVSIPEFPAIPANAAVVHHLWRGLPEHWDGEFQSLRLQMVTPGYAGRAFAALIEEGRCLNINALPMLMQREFPETYTNKLILIAGTVFVDLRTNQTFVQGISTTNTTFNRKSSFRLMSSERVQDRTYTITFRD